MGREMSTYGIPEDGLRGLKENWRHDLLSGFLVFLISLPLTLGVAMACDLPPFAGILTAIIGGVFVTFFQGSYIGIKAPAAGLIIIVTQCVRELGNGDIIEGYKLTLAVIVVSGILQMLLGIIRIGILGDFFPSSAVHGMLAAVGIIIATTQIHAILGSAADFSTVLETFRHIPDSVMHVNPEILVIGLICLIILFLLPLVQNRYIRMVPAPMLVVLIAIPLGHYFDLEHTHKYLFLNGSEYEIGPSYLVSIPANFIDGFTFPVFDKVLSLVSLKYVLMFALVGSLESLVSAKATDNLDVHKRKSDLNKDLFSIGLGNTICGFLGGLPMISEIVRSSSNAVNGARTRWSNFFNGLFILIFVVAAPRLIHQIPLSALAAMLIYVGARLASPKIFREIYRVGVMQFAIFATTIVVTLATDILIGMVAGIVVNFIIIVGSGVPLRALFKSNITVEKNENNKSYVFKILDAAVFSNYLSFKSRMDKVPQGYTIVLDFSGVKVIDHTVMEHIHYYGEDYQKAGVVINIKGMETLRPWSSHPLSYRVAASVSGEALFPNSRESELKQLAKSIGFKYRSSLPMSESNFGKFSSDNIRVKYEGNILSGKIGAHDYKISDLSVVEGGDLKAQIQQVTVLTISTILPSFPMFALSREGLMDKIMEKTFLNDIDFKEFPKFSDRYLLTAMNEKETRSFFGRDLIVFFEQQELYNVESYGMEVIIHKSKSMASPKAMLELLEFGKKLMSKVNQANVELNP